MDSMYPPRKDHPRARGTIARSVVGRLLVLTLLAAGCSTVKLYDGAELSAQRAAFVLLGGKWSITHATGNQRMWVDGHGIEPPVYRAAVAPGCHRIDYQLCPRCYAVGRQRERGYVLAAARQVDSALADFDEAIRLEPRLAGAYNNNYQIVQAPGYVMILVEMIHDVRIIPLDARPRLPQNVRQWTGNYLGHWEGETLVVESTNFTNKTAFQGSSENMRLTERFTRVSEDVMRYQFTVDDPATWAKPWSAEVPWKKTIGPLFEHACAEGNYGLANTLRGARAEEKRAAEKAAPTVSK